MSRFTQICSSSVSVRTSLPKKTDEALRYLSPAYLFKMQSVAAGPSTLSAENSLERSHTSSNTNADCTSHNNSEGTTIQDSNIEQVAAVWQSLRSSNQLAGKHSAASAARNETILRSSKLETQTRSAESQEDDAGKELAPRTLNGQNLVGRVHGTQENSKSASNIEMPRRFQWYSAAAATPYVTPEAASSGL